MRRLPDTHKLLARIIAAEHIAVLSLVGTVLSARDRDVALARIATELDKLVDLRPLTSDEGANETIRALIRGHQSETLATLARLLEEAQPSGRSRPH